MNLHRGDTSASTFGSVLCLDTALLGVPAQASANLPARSVAASASRALPTPTVEESAPKATYMPSSVPRDRPALNPISEAIFAEQIAAICNRAR